MDIKHYGMFTIFPTETSQILRNILIILTYQISDEIPLMVKRTY